ncbi:MAG: tetratricopeptide repeat protein, partial [Flammeovirgaceae bacterium]
MERLTDWRMGRPGIGAESPQPAENCGLGRGHVEQGLATRVAWAVREATNVIGLLSLVLLFSCNSKETRVQQFLLKGNLAAKERNFGQAENYYQEAIQLEPCFADAHNNLGTVHFQQKRYEQALPSYDKAIECKPNFLNALFNRANTEYELKEYYKALEDLDKVIAMKPDTALAYFTRGLVYTK